jgi:hypothetical protein
MSIYVFIVIIVIIRFLFSLQMFRNICVTCCPQCLLISKLFRLPKGNMLFPQDFQPANMSMTKSFVHFLNYVLGVCWWA